MKDGYGGALVDAVPVVPIFWAWKILAQKKSKKSRGNFKKNITSLNSIVTPKLIGNYGYDIIENFNENIVL